MFKQQGEISTDEADAFLITENNTRNTYRDHHPRINFPEKLNTHYIRVAHLYTKVYAFIRNCMEVCGLFYYTVRSCPNSMALINWLTHYVIFSPRILSCSTGDISIKH